ncbi:hypothetical protein MA16_Dca026544 [Dendrobium catenatum]|uniref:Uncharacterized protein n=1 Tax=Dendrobium catenatum TaxID=906689 RepID=A0A2I0V7X9_9ASPA|nr:hypothetical protein MA16_Dca026544 [Dendrobium catenatum]
MLASLGYVAESVFPPLYKDMLENLGRGVPHSNSAVEMQPLEKKDNDVYSFKELLWGFGGSSKPHKWQEPVQNNKPVLVMMQSYSCRLVKD